MKKIDLLVLLVVIFCVGFGSEALVVSINIDNLGNWFVALSGILFSYWLIVSREYNQN